jgi:pimeloyl-ACP methyl ester carboxylesterase
MTAANPGDEWDFFADLRTLDSGTRLRNGEDATTSNATSSADHSTTLPFRRRRADILYAAGRQCVSCFTIEREPVMIRRMCLLVLVATLATGLSVTAQEKKADANSPPVPQTFDSNGVKINYVVRGKGEPVLLIHGFAGNHSMNWAAVAGDLAKDYMVIAYDNRGHGRSGKPHDPAQYGQEMAEDAIRLLDHLKIDKAHVAGYSMGAFITARLVATHPDRLITATLGGAGWARPDDQLGASFMDELATSLENGNGITPLILRLTPEGEPKPEQSQIDATNQLVLLANDAKALAAVVRGMKNFTVEESVWLNNKVPLLALIGEIDPLKSGVDALEEIHTPNLEVVVIEGADHMNAFRRPEFRQAFREFLVEHSVKEVTPAAAAADE